MFHILFEKFLTDEYDLSIIDIKESCEKIIKQGLSSFKSIDVINHSITNITKYFKKDFFNDLIAINEKKDDLKLINSFDKSICFLVVKIFDEYHILSYEVFVDNFYKCIHRLVYKKANKMNKDELSNIKGQIFNENCEVLFKNIGFDIIYSNLIYKDGEIDLLIDDKDVLFVIECKARNYTDKISGLSNSFKKANENNLDYASKQVHRFIDCLKNDKSAILKNNDNSIK